MMTGMALPFDYYLIAYGGFMALCTLVATGGFYMVARALLGPRRPAVEPAPVFRTPHRRSERKRAA